MSIWELFILKATSWDDAQSWWLFCETENTKFKLFNKSPPSYPVELHKHICMLSGESTLSRLSAIPIKAFFHESSCIRRCQRQDKAFCLHIIIVCFHCVLRRMKKSWMRINVEQINTETNSFHRSEGFSTSPKTISWNIWLRNEKGRTTC